MKYIEEISNYEPGYINNQESYIRTLEIKEWKNKKLKTRKIVTYAENENGKKLRSFHEWFNERLNKRYQSCSLSFAYKKGVCCLDAVKLHINSNAFIKIDIHNYYESIFFDKFIQLIDNENIMKFRRKPSNYVDYYKACFYQGHLSLGFVTSPVISDIYLTKFDEVIQKKIKGTKLVYSRYCDDILISTNDVDFGELDTLYYFIIDELKKYDLEINEKKTRKEFLKLEKHNAITYLGLTISKLNESENKISISKRFIVDTLEKIDRYYNGHESFILKNVILSRVAYLKQNSNYSYKKFLNKYQNRFNKKYTGLK